MHRPAGPQVRKVGVTWVSKCRFRNSSERELRNHSILQTERDDARGTGYDVVLWIEEMVATTDFLPPEIVVHSANLSARAKMEAGIRSIASLTSKLSS